MTGAVHRARDARSGAVFVERLRVADTHWTRLRGLLGTAGLAPGDGLWLKPCRRIHMIGMRYPIDVVFLDDANHVVRTVAGLAPPRLSPHVAEAASALELPVGTIARAGLAEGARIAIEGDGRASTPRRRLGPLFVNAALATLYAIFVSVHVAVARHTGAWGLTLPIVVQESLLVVLFCARRPSRDTSQRVVDWAAGIAGTFLPLFLRPTVAAGGFAWIGEPVQVIGVSSAVVALVFLGRSIGLVPANRGVKVSGAYTLVRHPMYAAYLLGYLGYVVSYPSARNVAIAAGTAVAMHVRCGAEERLLARDPSYRAYLERTRWRLFPGLY